MDKLLATWSDTPITIDPDIMETDLALEETRVGTCEAVYYGSEALESGPGSESG